MSKKHESFGKYVLLEKLATGGMAEVFLGRAQGAGGIGKFFAIKRILPQYSDNTDFRRMFQEEAKIAINLSHSNIVSIFEFGIETGQLYLTMDYVEGRNLRQILNKMKGTESYFSSEQILFMIKEVSAGLDHAHRSLNGATGKPLNITHRDISPQNIMVSFEGEIKVVDFGIAKAENQVEQTKTGTLKGKFGYMSPEQAEGQNTDLRTDIFSLGIVLWEMLARDRLFTANNEINVLRKIRDCHIPSLKKIDPNIDPELERICMKALARDRNLRYQTSAALHRDLNRFLNRKYPDFSSHDFSVFIKTLYADEILDTRKRLIEYSKMSAQQAANDPTIITGSNKNIEEPNLPTRTATATRNDSSTDGKPQTPQSSKKSLSQLLNLDDLKNLKLENTKSTSSSVKALSDDALKESLGVLADEQSALTENGQGQTSPTVTEGPTSTGKSDLSIQSQIENSPVESTAIRIPQVDPSPANMEIDDSIDGNVSIIKQQKSGADSSSKMSAILFLVVFALSYSLIVRQFSDMVVIQKLTFAVEGILPFMKMIHGTGYRESATETSEFSIPPLPEKSPLQNLEPATPAEVTLNPALENPADPPPIPLPLTGSRWLIVNSSPSGADIYLDGVATKGTTPSRIKIPLGRTFDITLKKDRYNIYERQGLDAQKIGRTLTANLMKANVAFLDIDVRPPRNARVYIDGKILKGELLPITNYAVTADRELIIEAENPITGSRAREKVKLSQDQRKVIILKLKSPATRSPSRINKSN